MIMKKLIPVIFFLAFLINLPTHMTYWNPSNNLVAVTTEGIDHAEVMDWHLDVHLDQKGKAIFGIPFSLMGTVILVFAVVMKPIVLNRHRFLTPIYYQSSYLI
ncbi:hypothetical protein [Radiobacillus deserti]|uniref:Uncharacterized protein n=1 Tax=Radiobacillus deserti TaxID=2594883 RepID=A0A516KCB2_9BACI|nr:hypothetical protein [Radiobacillus deserti]QDP39044.1 hypothetical protein FN924_01755 [Radiobacillus deserti]